METLKNPYADPAPVNPWPEDDQAEKKKITTQIAGLINALVLHFSLSKHAENLDDTFPGLSGIRAESDNAKGRAIEIMRELLEAWK